MVHIEIIQYLAGCNRYSDTTQALSDYLGQTKSSISQSLSNLEDLGFIRRSQDKSDKRMFHLHLTRKGEKIAEAFQERIETNLSPTDNTAESFRSLLTMLQKKNSMRSFGICSTCRFNQNPEKDVFVCGLTKERLTSQDTKKRCREHEAG